MELSPKFSIIMPAYNSAEFIDLSINSVLSQNFSDWELIIIDDGSVDDTRKIVERISEYDDRIEYHFKDNSGPADAKNLGIQLAKGEYILFLDADDLLANGALSELDSVTGDGTDFVIFSYERFDDSELKYGVSNKSSDQFDAMFTAVWNKLYRTSLVKKLHFPKGTFYEDVAFSAMARMISEKTKIIPAETPLYYYRQRNGSVTKSSENNARRHLDVIVDFQEMFDFIQKNEINLTSMEYLSLYRLINTVLFSHMLQVSQMRMKNPGLKRTVIKELRSFQLQANDGLEIVYSVNALLNIKQHLLVFLISSGAYSVANVIARFSNRVARKTY